MTLSADVVVLGAGPAGLGAAYRLAARGRSVVVVERECHVGGLAASFDVAGVRVDHGSHRLHPSTPPGVMTALRSLLGDDLQRRTRNGRIRIAGGYVAFPPRPGDLARRLPPRLVARMAADVLTGPLRGRRADTFAEAVRVAVGPTLAGEFYCPYAAKLFGRDARDLSPELAVRRVGARSPLDVLRKALRRTPDAGVFYSPVHGFGQIADALAQAATGAGADLRLGSEVARVDTAAHGVTVSLADGTNVGAAQVWSTIPLPTLARVGGAPPAVLDAAEGLAHRALVLVYLVVERSSWTEFDAHYFPGAGVPMHRVSEPKNYRDCADDPHDVTVLCAEVPCDVGDATWCMHERDLGELVAASLAREGLPPVVPARVEVRRLPHAYPVYDLGHAARFAALDAWATSRPRLLSFGRQGLFVHDNTHHALAMAWAAADALTDEGAVDRARWESARARFATHVVED